MDLDWSCLSLVLCSMSWVFLSLADFRICHEAIILLLGCVLSSLGLCFQAGKIGLDNLEHANHTASGCTHALVRLIKNLRSFRLLLHQCCSLPRLLIKLPKHSERLGHGFLSLLGICNGLSVLCLFCLADRCCLCNLRIDL